MIGELRQNKRFNNILFVIWAGGSALLTYSLIYALRKPFTAALYDGYTFLGVDYKVAATIIQIVGYLIAKFFAIKIISELKKENRFKFFLCSVVLAELSLLMFAVLPVPFNALALLVNGLSLGGIWGVIFSFIEGRRFTDILASMLGVSMVFSSGLAKDLALFFINDVGISEFWMPALIGAIALPLLALLAYSLVKLPNPTREDIENRTERKAINNLERKRIFRTYIVTLTFILLANSGIIILRDLRESFLVYILDANDYSSWMFTRIDALVTIIILVIFWMIAFVKKNIPVLIGLLALSILSCLVMCFVSVSHELLGLSPVVWLFCQSLPLYITYLVFQTIFFDRFIAGFRIESNIGYFITLTDFVGYAGTVLTLLFIEMLHVDTDWFELYNSMAFWVGVIGVASFMVALISLLYINKRRVNKI